MKVLVVDDHPLVRKGLRSILSLENNLDNIYEAANIEEAMLILEQEVIDVAIVDLYLGKEFGLDVVERARKSSQNLTKFIILTSSMREEDFNKANKANVDGYILKGAYTDDIIYALRVVVRGKRFIDPEILYYVNTQQNDHSIEHLTSREKDILLVLGEGLSNQQIADKLYISENTVKKHISSIFAKLGMEHRTQAALYANSNNNLGVYSNY